MINFKNTVIVSFLIISALITGCSGKTNTPKNTLSQTTAEETEETAMIKTISPEEAKNIMDTESEYVILDVRTDEEFAEGHIKDAVLVPDYEISDKVGAIIPDKNTEVLVYCRSGRRSAAAAQQMARIGYTNVLDFGGIIDWPYETVK